MDGKTDSVRNELANDGTECDCHFLGEIPPLRMETRSTIEL